MLVIAGPQGSGNHMWSKILCLHPSVMGWKDLLDEYWIGHDREPFSEYWQFPERLTQYDWSKSDYYVTGVSIPYMLNGERTRPDLDAFINCVPIEVQLCIIGRDRNILGMQETRLRGEPTYPMAIEMVEQLRHHRPFFLSYELLHLYRGEYLRQLSIDLGFPIVTNGEKIDDILIDDTNNKYLTTVESHWVDKLAQKTSERWR